MNLRETALKLFADVLVKVDAENALRRAVRLENSKLQIFDRVFDLADFSEIYAIALGKAGFSMALGLDGILKEKITAGVVSAPKSETLLPARWQVFTGGHPLPNHDSLASASAAISLLKKANHKKSLVIFLVSGGGSAMIELPSDEKISLEDLQETNKILVGCGATIGEINSIRRCFSKIKGGGLSELAPLAAQVSLIISDTNQGDEANVASGPTIKPLKKRNLPSNVAQIIAKYNLIRILPNSVSDVLDRFSDSFMFRSENNINHSIFTLLDNQSTLETIAKATKHLGFLTEIAVDLIETPIETGCLELVKRLFNLRQTAERQPVALISGGEFACPVQGSGIGGRNLEATLRCILELEKIQPEGFRFVVLNAGTDGIDGNSPATGAIADDTTLERAKALKLNANKFLKKSDAYTFFARLNDAIVTGATGTNVRDVRILLAL